MTTIAHASLTGAELHEPKSIETATVGQVYVANGAGSGNWSSIDATAFTGMVADFATPMAPNGWLECDGSVISTSTYANLYAVMTIQQNGTRTNGSAVITSLPDTSKIKQGYFVFGTGINTGTTVLSVDSGSQITLSANATSSGTNTVIVSPWLLNTGTIKLPDLTTAGRYRRSRVAGQAVGIALADQFASHNHTASFTGNVVSDHTHTINDPGHFHTTVSSATPLTAFNAPVTVTNSGTGSAQAVFPVSSFQNLFNYLTTASGTGISGTNNGGGHTPSGSVSVSNTGSAETRPISMIFITCVKT